MEKLLKRVVLILIAAEGVYLALGNLALNLPLTQSLINQHRPEQYAVHWEQAWTLYPLRVHARGISANGQSPSQQWQADVGAASVSASLLPLLARTVRLSNVDAEDVSFRLRPRLGPDKDFAGIQDFFPPIAGRDPQAPAAPGKASEHRQGWKIQVADVHVSGRHDLWVREARAALTGHLRGNLAFQAPDGPVSVDKGVADVALQSLVLNGDWEVASAGTLQGRFELARLMPAEDRGLKALGFLSVDADVDVPVDSLEFLDFYLRALGGMTVDGSGRLFGQVRYEEGALLEGTDVQIAADELVLSVEPYALRGAGGVAIEVGADRPETLVIGIDFADLEALHTEDEVPLFTGHGLNVEASGPNRILPDDRLGDHGRVSVTIPSVGVPDLRVYQRFVPERWATVLEGGDGQLEGRVIYSDTDLSTRLDLTSENADISIRGYRFRSNLDLGLRIEAAAGSRAGADLSGTYLRLDDARLAVDGNINPEGRPWQAHLEIKQGALGVTVPEDDPGEPAGFGDLAVAFKEQGVKRLLSSAEARLDALLEVSELSWINLFFNNSLNLAVGGSGEVAADLRLASGQLAEGTRLSVTPKGLTVRVLDYVARGAGGLVIDVEKGGAAPDLRLEAELKDAHLQRIGEEGAAIEHVNIAVSALAAGVSLDKNGDAGGQVRSLGLRIPSARIPDMRVYNDYLPEGVPLQLLGGQADLDVDILLGPESASGFVKLITDGFQARLGEQRVSGRLALDARLRDGVPGEMDFDIGGSTLVLDDFRVAGAQRSYDQPHWKASFDLEKARVQWRKPLRLKLDAEIAMQDSRPIVAMLSNQRGKHGFLEKILTVKDINGRGQMRIADNRVLVPYAMAGSDKIDVGVKARVTKEEREGMFFARFRAIEGILRTRNDARSFSLIGARKRFDAYVPGETSLDLGGD